MIKLHYFCAPIALQLRSFALFRARFALVLRSFCALSRSDFILFYLRSFCALLCVGNFRNRSAKERNILLENALFCANSAKRAQKERKRSAKERNWSAKERKRSAF